MAKDNFREVERIEIDPFTGEKRITYKAKGIEKFKEGKVVSKILIGFMAIILGFTVFSKPKEETPTTAFEMFKDNPETSEIEIGWIDYQPNLPRFKNTLERFANTFEENTIQKINLTVQEELIKEEWAILDGFRQWINTALGKVVSFTSTLANVGITAINSIINIFKFLINI